MRRDFMDITASPSKAAITGAIGVGLASNVLRIVPAGYTFAYLNKIFIPALQHNHVKFYYDSRGYEIGFVVWAYLGDGMDERFFKEQEWNLHISEWNEGENLWIIDLVAPHGHLAKILEHLTVEFFSSEKKVSYCRVRRGKVICQTWARSGTGRLYLQSPRKHTSQ